MTAGRALLEEVFGARLAEKILHRRYNIAPSQRIAAVLNTDPRTIEFARWGLIPRWAKDASIGHRLINARVETLAAKPAFRDSLRKRRCLIPADGFYEWKSMGQTKTPMLLRPPEGDPLALAGLWERWIDPKGQEVRSCTIITTAATPFMAAIHDRMPLILPTESWDRWLTPQELPPAEAEALLSAPRKLDLVAVEVSRAVNSPANDSPALIEPVKP